MRALVLLRAPVDAFFDAVTVNATDPRLRENRLKLLNALRAATREVADFSGSRDERRALPRKGGRRAHGACFASGREPLTPTFSRWRGEGASGRPLPCRQILTCVLPDTKILWAS
jgi:hypothetical protein